MAWENFLTVSYELNIHLFSDPEIPPHWSFPKKNKNVCTYKCLWNLYSLYMKVGNNSTVYHTQKKSYNITLFNNKKITYKR